jgi:glycosyltransferase involved in cell wall biosynthesis
VTAPAPPQGARERLRVVMLLDKVRRPGGAERAAVAIATHLPRDRFEVVMVTTRPSFGSFLDGVTADGLRHVAIERRRRLDPAAFRRLVRLLRDEEVDVLHSHMFGSNLWGSLFGRLAGVPAVIAHEHTWSYEGQPLRRFLDGHVIGRLADAFVAVSERDRERMIALERVPAEKIVLLPNPYVPRPRGDGVDLRRQLDLRPGTPMVTTVAVLRPQKALEVLLDAFARLSERMPEARLVIAGDGPSRESLEGHARAVGLDGRVHFLGYRDDVGGLLDAADVAALSSDYEGWPLFAMECMAHRTPLVTTDVGNVGALLGEDEGVVVVPRRDPAALAGALEALLRDPARREAQAAAAAQRLPTFEVDSVAREFGDLYERLVARGARQQAGRQTRRGRAGRWRLAA